MIEQARQGRIMAGGWPVPKIRDQQSSRLVVKSLAAILLAICGSTLWAMQSSAQEAEQDSQSGSDASLTEQQWRQRVEDARTRSAEFVAKAKAGTAEVESANEEKKLADQRAMNDPSLRAGDIVSTSNGFLVFQGFEDGEHQWRDFRSATDSEIAALRLSAPKH
jgi:hypothetical protein